MLKNDKLLTAAHELNVVKAVLAEIYSYNFAEQLPLDLFDVMKNWTGISTAAGRVQCGKLVITTTKTFMHQN